MTASTYEQTGRLQRKIDVYKRCAGGGMLYLHSTNWHKRCREALAAAYVARQGRDAPGTLTARFADKGRG